MLARARAGAKRWVQLGRSGRGDESPLPVCPFVGSPRTPALQTELRSVTREELDVVRRVPVRFDSTVSDGPLEGRLEVPEALARGDRERRHERVTEPLGQRRNDRVLGHDLRRPIRELVQTLVVALPLV